MFAFRNQGIEIIITQFFHIDGSLVEADEGRSHLGLNDFAFLRLETDHGTYMTGSLFFRTFFQRVVGKRRFVGKRFIEFDNKVVLEVLGNTAAILGRVTDNFVFFRNDFDIRTVIQRVYHYVRMVVFREGETEQSGTVGRSQLRYHIVIGQIGFIIIRFHHFTLMGEPAGTFILVKFRSAHYGHNGKLSVIVDPRTWLVGLFESSYLVCGIYILPSVSHLSCLGSPEVHPPGTGNGGISVSCR